MADPVQLTGVMNLWEQGFRGEGVRVAVFDSGLTTSESASQFGSVIGQFDFTSDGSVVRMIARAHVRLRLTDVAEGPHWPRNISGRDHWCTGGVPWAGTQGGADCLQSVQ